MTAPRLPDDAAALAAMANGIIPSDHLDAGAASVNAGERLAQKMAAGAGQTPYEQGLKTAREVARERFGREPEALSPAEIHDLLGVIREVSPSFFKQLRMDVSALYLGDAAVWQRIGFPGPSTASGGYPDFDQPQHEVIHHLKEPIP